MPVLFTEKRLLNLESLTTFPLFARDLFDIYDRGVVFNLVPTRHSVIKFTSSVYVDGGVVCRWMLLVRRSIGTCRI
jgi:hypothetical protein